MGGWEQVGLGSCQPSAPTCLHSRQECLLRGCPVASAKLTMAPCVCTGGGEGRHCSPGHFPPWLAAGVPVPGHLAQGYSGCLREVCVCDAGVYVCLCVCVCMCVRCCRGVWLCVCSTCFSDSMYLGLRAPVCAMNLPSSACVSVPIWVCLWSISTPGG